MSTQEYTTAYRLPLAQARDPRYRDLVRQFAMQTTSKAARASLLAIIGEGRP